MDTMNQAQSAAVTKLASRDPKLQMRWDHDRRAPALLKGRLAEPFAGPVRNNGGAAAVDFLDDQKQLFRMRAPREELRVIRKTTDARGNHCVALQQRYRGIPIHGATVRVHFTPDRAVYQTTSKYQPDLELDDVEPTLDVQAAYAKALDAAGGGSRVEEVAPRLEICPTRAGSRLAWVVEVLAADSGRPMRYFVDAKDGAILKGFSTLQFVGTGVYSGGGALNSEANAGTFRLRDATRTANGGPAIHTCDMDNQAYNVATPSDANISVDANDNWNNTTTNPRHGNQGAEVDVHRYIGQVVDYYRNTHNWNGMDGNGTDIYCGAHVQFPGLGGPNNAAYWSATDCFYFGDGDGADFDYLSPLDIAAHEFTHGVTNHTSNLDYADEAGGLNEAFSDIFAAFVDNADLQIGEDCTTPGIPGDSLRDLDDPANPNPLSRIPNHVLPAFDTMGIGYFDGQDPHAACGPMIYVAGLLLVGGTHPNTNITVPSIGYARCEQIFWHVQSNGLLGNNDATFLECREAAVNAVDALFAGDPNYLETLHAVTCAFSAVGIGPDVYIRDNTGDDGTIPNAHPLYRSPDIIVRQTQEADPQTAFADLGDDTLSEDVEAGQDNWVYLRLHNRGAVAGDITVRLYWAAPNTFAMPAQWHLIDTVQVVDVQPGALTIGEARWQQQDLPPIGHFCLIAEVDSAVDPAPDRTLITNGSLFSRFVAESNNFAWKNINVVDVLPAGLVDFEFMISGDAQTDHEIQIDLTELPASSEAYLRILRRLCEGAELINLQFREANSRYSYYDLAPGKLARLRHVAFGDDDSSELHVFLRIPDTGTTVYSITNTQLANGAVTGRITQVVNLLASDDFDFIGNANSREVHKRECDWVGRMNEDNKRGFRSLVNAHNAGYDNCAYCIGDSRR